MGAPRPGEFELIARHFAPLAAPGGLGLLDDAAVIAPPPGHDLVVTCDALVAGVHFFAHDPPACIARKALRVNLSDLAAKGAAPLGFLLALALPDDWTESWLAAFARGLGEDAALHGCPLLGGDTVRAAGPLTLGVTALGSVPAGAMVRRRGARPGDRLLVTGTLGDAALGLALRAGPPPSWATALTGDEHAHLAERYLLPCPRLALAPALRRHARAAMDLSDGLAGDLPKLLGPGLGAAVRLADLPLSPAARAALAADPALVEAVAAGGDDYELLVAVAPESSAALVAEAAALGLALTDVGVVAEGEALFLDATGNAVTFARPSFAHF